MRFLALSVWIPARVSKDQVLGQPRQADQAFAAVQEASPAKPAARARHHNKECVFWHSQFGFPPSWPRRMPAIGFGGRSTWNGPASRLPATTPIWNARKSASWTDPAS